MENCLKRSVEQYRKIVEHAEQLGVLLKQADPEILLGYTERLRELQDEAQQHDQAFVRVFSQHASELINHPLFIEREQLFEKIVKLNHLLLPRIRGMMAVTAHEISQIKGGRTAMAGYHQPPRKNRRSVRGIG